MQTFWRTVRFAWPYRVRLAVSLACGVVVAVFWGANISAIYPVLNVLLENETLVGWCERQITQQEGEISSLEAKIAAWDRTIQQQQQTGQSADTATRKRQQDLDQLAKRRQGLSWYEWALPALRKYTPKDSFETLGMLVLILVTGMLIKGVFDFLQVYFAGSVVHLSVFDLRNQFYRRTMALDLSHFSEKGTHDLMARFTSDIESLSSGLRSLLNKVLLEPLKSLSCLAFACWFNWRLTLVSLLLFPSAGLVMWLVGRYLKRVSRRNLESMARIYKILQESFQGIRVVKAFTMERYERRRFFTETKKYYHQSMKLIRADALGGPILEVVAVSAVLGTLVVGSYLVLRGETHIWGIRLTHDRLDKGMLLTLYGLILGTCDPLRKVFSVYGRVQRGMAGAERIFQCMDRSARVAQKPRAANLARHRQCVEFANVNFGYDPGRPVLRNVDLTVEFGETIAIVGTTGCGKTTLINLLPRFYDPVQGSVQIDSVDLCDVSLRSLRQQIGIVTQHTILFDDTVFNNITYGNRDVDQATVEAAAKSAYAHRFIEQMPEGYHTRIGEMGAALSGGQRQRIALARAILRDPAILILDEATSSLDVESESLIHKALRSFIRGRTTFIVTHRLSTLDIADRIVVIEEGQIEAVGTHQELLLRSETYRRLQNVKAKRA